MSCLNYQKVWEVMNELEDKFNNVTTVNGLVEFIDQAVEKNNQDEIRSGVDALKSYMKVFISEYDTASKRAWNNTVVALKQHPHESDYPTGNVEIKAPTYEEVEEFFTNVDEGVGVV